MNQNDSELDYVGFWLRVGAAIIDSILLAAIIGPIVTALYGHQYLASTALVRGPGDFLLNWLFPAVAVVAFWVARQATPGKMVIGARIVDAETGRALSVGQSIGRYLGYYVSMLPFMLGILWVALDRRKQGWHDKLAGTVVIRPRASGPDAVRFRGE